MKNSIIILGISLAALVGMFIYESRANAAWWGSQDDTYTPVEYPEGYATFTYSGGCFWCTESNTEKLEGVYDVVSGFSGGTTDNPVYRSGGWGDHVEGAKVYYDPKKLSYSDLVKHVYETIDYEDGSGQFCDRGLSYEPRIYYKTTEEAQIATDLAPETSVVPIVPEAEFYPVRDEQQSYYTKNPIRYKYYRNSCGRDRRMEQLNGRN